MADRWLDISRYQGTPNFDQIKASGLVQGVIIKAGGADGGLYTDSQFKRNFAEAQRVGLPAGVYFFFDPRSSAIDQQVNYFVSIAPTALFHAADIEVASSATVDLTAWCDTCLDHLSAQVGATWAYSYGPFWRAHYHGTNLAKYPLWEASYTSAQPPPAPPWSMLAAWQYTDAFTCPGISGNVDASYVYITIGDQPLTSQDMQWVQQQIANAVGPLATENDAQNNRLLEYAYAQELGRTVDAPSFSSWVSIMKSGTWENFIQQLHNTPEAQNFRATGQPDLAGHPGSIAVASASAPHSGATHTHTVQVDDATGHPVTVTTSASA